MLRGTMDEKCKGCPNKKEHPIFGGYFCDLMKRSFCGLEPNIFLDCKKEAVEGRETRLDLPKVPAEKEALKDGKGD